MCSVSYPYDKENGRITRSRYNFERSTHFILHDHEVNVYNLDEIGFKRDMLMVMHQFNRILLDKITVESNCRRSVELIREELKKEQSTLSNSKIAQKGYLRRSEEAAKIEQLVLLYVKTGGSNDKKDIYEDRFFIRKSFKDQLEKGRAPNLVDLQENVRKLNQRWSNGVDLQQRIEKHLGYSLDK